MSEANEYEPEWTERGEPLCTDSCRQYDGKRCRLIGFRPDRYCEPAIVGLAARSDSYSHEIAAARELIEELQDRVAELEAENEAPLEAQQWAPSLNKLDAVVVAFEALDREIVKDGRSPATRLKALGLAIDELRAYGEEGGA